MKYIYNNKKFRERRGDLRNKQTEAERILWWHIGDRHLDDNRFFRQYSVGPYILDFYCPKARLAIELDGKTHLPSEQRIYDSERTQYLEANDIKVIRFWNDEIENDLEAVLEKIYKLTPP
ncbi:hypothetical protein A3B05_01730 [Candidatus Giovannonibacteria bacterium RIFCSPLOWO2_01_FULL_43_160]|uniref:DUF559 domain-containing protein n=2 Tax=Candidatus Giovannoniibacteriota TaxID=1752738 RepID=A0A0G1ITT1_9BACT|nr:MAG: hypothetical protein UV72_C0009G0022 [Candidatus Giovannonibacteria bacterium GW2011_GWB1_43_13]KKS99043.1 MAG: hypothetical protein UV75_C0012G0014 [Candidatus Giovannonibacteria bacterium GW2011_GWA1_43_15]KKT20624.1 MAG: hypothetical protein UW05_C0034G0009 [Candidatus Giovannonibacteria bacterium GW2011_GWC2_43_8]KKT62373.1 MAG: hypothetical protein UW55_C0013G0014 [Candidatus Giovannonibacteria bacterium GW2011_GWA2_44_26]OGF59496.1 MAG: hypothetical protein A2652_01020 [Candidatus